MSAPTRRLRTRHLVSALLGATAIGLGTGPVLASFEEGQPVWNRSTETAPAADPPAQRRAKPPTEGVWDTTGDAVRALRPPRVLTPEEAQADRPSARRYVVVTGTVTGEAGRQSLPGVGVLVTQRDRERVAAWGEVPPTLDVLAQVKPRRLERTGLTPASGTSGDLRTVVTEEIAPRITSRSGLVAGRVVSDLEGPGLLRPQGTGLAATTRGRAYIVAAHAVPPGSRTVAVTTRASGISVLAFGHGDGGGALLVYNIGAARSLVVDLLVGDTVQRHTLDVARRSLTAMVLPAPPDA